MDNKIYAVMATAGESWRPVAIYHSEDRAKEVAKILGYRLFGDRDGCDSLYLDYIFSVIEVDLEPEIIDTGTRQYHWADGDEPPLPLIPDFDNPEDMYSTALMLERDDIYTQRGDIILAEPEG